MNKLITRSVYTTTKDQRAALLMRLRDAKDHSKLSLNQISKKLGCTNVYTSQLLIGQAQLKAGTVEKLKAVLPHLNQSDLEEMGKPLIRSYNKKIIQDPTVYRLTEAVLHNGVSIKSLIDEEFGDGIMSAIDVFITVDKVKGKSGEDRVVLTLNGKFLPHVEQLTENNTAV